MNCFRFQSRVLYALHRKSSYTEKAQGSTFPTSAALTAKNSSETKRKSVLKDVKSQILNYEKIKEMNVEQRGRKAKELQRLCVKCLSVAYKMKNCSGLLCDVNCCRNPYKNVEQKQNVGNFEEVSNVSSMRSKWVRLPVIPVTIESGSSTPKTFTLCDYGTSLSSVVEKSMKTQTLTEQPATLNVSGTHGTSDISRKRFGVKIGDKRE